MKHARATLHILSGAVTSLLLASASSAAPADAQQLEPGALRSLIPGVRVMTQNLYIGLDVFAVTGAAPEEIPFAVAAAFADFVANRPADRLAAIADEIAVLQPHLIGLQEVVELFEQFPSDAIAGQLEPNATDEVIDFLDVLLSDLASRGLRYEVAAQQPGVDIELPRFDGVVDAAPVFTDVRVRFSDVILRRAGVPTQPLFAFNYAATLPIPSLPGLAVKRSAVGVTASVRGDTFRFASTQLEPLVPGLPDASQPQLAQALELIERLAAEGDPASATIVVGDFNSQAEVGATYLQVTGAGYEDLWALREPLGQSGFTCCQEVVLDNPESALSERIDFIFTNNLRLRHPILAFTVGDEPFNRTRTRPRLWPSDHAGVAGLLIF